MNLVKYYIQFNKKEAKFLKLPEKIYTGHNFDANVVTSILTATEFDNPDKAKCYVQLLNEYGPKYVQSEYCVVKITVPLELVK